MTLRKNLTGISVLLALLIATPDGYAQYQVGDRLQIGNETGTVISIGPPVYSGGNQVKVHLDRFTDAFPEQGVMYDPSVVKMKKIGTGPLPGTGGTPGGGGMSGPAALPGASSTPGGAGLPHLGLPNFNPGNNIVNNAIQAAKNFMKGQRVFIGNLNEWGTVTGPGRGPNLVRVHLDRYGNLPSTVDFDPIASKLKGAGQAGAPADPGPAKGAGGDPNQGPGPGDQANQVGDNAAPSEATFKKIIEANILPPGWGDTLSYQWQAFSMSGPMPYDVKYAGHLNQETILGGPGKSVLAYKVHAKYTMITHYQDKFADDQAVTKEGDYMIYKDPNGHWVPEGLNIQLSPTQYIKKQ